MTTLGPDAPAFPFKEVLWPLGMTRTVPENRLARALRDVEPGLDDR